MSLSVSLPGMVQSELKCAVQERRVVGVGGGRHGLEPGIRSAVSERIEGSISEDEGGHTRRKRRGLGMNELACGVSCCGIEGLFRRCCGNM